MKILITGGAGYIGSRLTLRLAALGHTVVALDNLRRGTAGALQGQGEFVEGDIRNEALLLELTRGVEIVFHLAAESAVMSAASDPEYCFSTNVTGTFRMVRAAQLNGVRRFVFASSREVYGDAPLLPVHESTRLNPRNDYGASKAAGEMCCGAFSGEMSIVRLSNVYGPGDKGRVIPRFIERALAGQPLILFGTGQLMDFVWIETVIDSLLCLGLGPWHPHPLNIASGRGTSILELAARVVLEANSQSPVTIQDQRDQEVMQYIADVTAANRAIHLQKPDDPLFALPEVIRHARALLG